MSEQKKDGSRLLVQPDPLVQEDRRFWHEKAKELVGNSPNALDETAKQIINISSILGGLYFSSITFSNLRNQITNVWTPFVYLLPLIFILFALIASFFTLFPNNYPVNIYSSKAIKKAHEDIVNRKWKSLCWAGSFLVASIVCLIVVVWIYLAKI